MSEDFITFIFQLRLFWPRLIFFLRYCWGLFKVVVLFVLLGNLSKIKIEALFSRSTCLFLIFSSTLFWSLRPYFIFSRWLLKSSGSLFLNHDAAFLMFSVTLFKIIIKISQRSMILLGYFHFLIDLFLSLSHLLSTPTFTKDQDQGNHSTSQSPLYF